jgi:hypothetical protein
MNDRATYRPDQQSTRVHRQLRIAGWILLPGTAALVVRQAIELADVAGRSQMLLFTFAHEHPVLLLLMVLSFFGAHAWLVAAIGIALLRRVRKRDEVEVDWLQVLVILVLVVAGYLPRVLL